MRKSLNYLAPSPNVNNTGKAILGSHNNKIDCVVIGLGRIGFELTRDPYREKPCTHTEAIQAHPRTQLLAGIDINPNKRKSFNQQTRVPTYPDWNNYLNYHPIPGILCIATPPSTHGEYLRVALKYKIPVVVVEKPITSTYHEALSLKKVFRNSSTRVIVNHERRFADDYYYVKKTIEKKKYGDLLSLNGYLFTHFGSPFQILYHDGTHLLDIADFLTKPEEKVKNKKTSPQIKKLQRQHQGKDKALRFTTSLNGVPCFFEVGGEKQFFHFELHLIFQKGIIHIGNHIYNEWVAGPSRHYKGFISLNQKKKIFSKTHYFLNMLKHAIHLYDHPKKQSESSIEDALLIFKVYQGLSKK